MIKSIYSLYLSPWFTSSSLLSLCPSLSPSLSLSYSEERMAQMNLELEMSKANALETTVNADSNLSFEMSEADM